MNRIIISFALCIAPLAASELPPEGADSLSSTQANYDGNSLILTGHVVLDHGLGKMTAEEASLQRQEAGKDFPFSLIQLRKDVLLALKNSAQITCGSADLDFTTLKGTLLPAEHGKVVYSDQIKKKKGGDATPLKLSGELVELNFSKQSSEGKKTNYEIDTILAKQEVVIEYADNFELQAHHALYRKGSSQSDKTSQREFRGVVTAYPQDEQSQCRLVHEGDEVLADMIDIDLLGSKISLLRPKGVLATSLLSHIQKAHMRFQSDYLYWDDTKHLLTLKGHITIDEPTIGTLNTQDELQITQATIKDKRVLQHLHAKGYSTLSYKDEHAHCHKLISHGFVDVDRDKLCATIESPTHDNSVPLEKQLYYEEEDSAFYADSALLEYSLSEHLMQPSLLTLKGNIRLFSHDPLKPPRFGIADRLTYSLSTRTLILSANPGKKVLLWDETQGMRLSAPEIHIVHDPNTKQQNIKGIGAVQFSFTPEEQSKFRQFFPQLKTLP